MGSTRIGLNPLFPISLPKGTPSRPSSSKYNSTPKQSPGRLPHPHEDKAVSVCRPVSRVDKQLESDISVPGPMSWKSDEFKLKKDHEHLLANAKHHGFERSPLFPKTPSELAAHQADMRESEARKLKEKVIKSEELKSMMHASKVKVTTVDPAHTFNRGNIREDASGKTSDAASNTDLGGPQQTPSENSIKENMNGEDAETKHRLTATGKTAAERHREEPDNVTEADEDEHLNDTGFPDPGAAKRQGPSDSAEAGDAKNPEVEDKWGVNGKDPSGWAEIPCLHPDGQWGFKIIPVYDSATLIRDSGLIRPVSDPRLTTAVTPTLSICRPIRAVDAQDASTPALPEADKEDANRPGDDREERRRSNGRM